MKFNVHTKIGFKKIQDYIKMVNSWKFGENATLEVSLKKEYGIISFSYEVGVIKKNGDVTKTFIRMPLKISNYNKNTCICCTDIYSHTKKEYQEEIQRIIDKIGV